MRVWIIALIALMVSGCAAAPYEPTIRLSVLQPLPVQGEDVLVPLRVSVAAVISPTGTAESYQPLLTYLSAQLDRPVELVQRRTYAETNELIEQGLVDLAFVCTSAYISGRQQFEMELLVAPQVNGVTTYHALLIVRADSPARRMDDLRGTVFAFTDPTSHTGRVYPTALVQRLGSTPDRFFERTFFTYSHDNAIRAVAEGLADAAAVDSLVYEYAVARNPDLAQRVRVIHRSPPFGIPPVVVSPNVRPQLKATLQEVMLTMADDPTGSGPQALQVLGIDRFVLIDDQAYESARELIRTVGTLTP